MGWIIVMIFLTLIAVASWLGIRAYAKSASTELAIKPRTSKTLVLVTYIVIVGILTFVVSSHQIEAGNIGVVYQFGAISGQISEGFQFTAPWQSVRVESIQVQRHTFDNISAASKETQDVYIMATVNFQVSPQAIQSLYRTVGPGWFDKLIQPRVLNFFKEETVKYRTIDILPNRETIRTAVKARLIDSLSPYSVNVVDLLIDNISFNKAFTDAIEEKQIAAQQALAEQERIASVQAQAQQRIEQAKGEAEATLLQAEAQAKANDRLNQSLTEMLVRWQAIQNLSDNVQIILVPSDSNFLYNIGGKTLP